MPKIDLTIAIGCESGQGSATLAFPIVTLCSRRGLNSFVYCAFQNIIIGGHVLETIRISDQPLRNHGDKIDVLVALNQDTINRHLELLKPGSRILFDSERITFPTTIETGILLFPLPVRTLASKVQTPLENRFLSMTQVSILLGAVIQMFGIDFQLLDEDLRHRFRKRPAEQIEKIVGQAQAGYEYSTLNFASSGIPLPECRGTLACLCGNQAFGLGGIAAGVKFYCAYPSVGSSGILMYMAQHAKKTGIVVHQAEDDIAAICMTIGAAQAGCRAMCGTTGGGFALMGEALGMAAMMEIPIVCIHVQRAGPANALATKTEQSSLSQILGAGQGDYPRVVVAPTTILDCYKSIPEVFNLVDKLQCPGIVVSDFHLSVCNSTIDPALLDLHPEIQRGELIMPEHRGGNINPTSGYNDNSYLRYKNTEDGVSPRAVPGTPGCIHIVSTDEHDEDGTLISDEFTNPHKRRMMHEKRMRKMNGAEKLVPVPELVGSENAEVTLVGWGSTEGVIREAIEKLASEDKVIANNLQIKWLVPFHADEVMKILSRSKKVIIIENNYSGQFAKFLRAETGFVAQGHIRKYDGEPFMPHHIVEGVKNQLAGKEQLSVPVHEVRV